MKSSTMPPRRSSGACSGCGRERGRGSRRASGSRARAPSVAWSGPSRKAWPICETSKRPAAFAHVAVLGDDAGRILDGHGIAGEGHHARTEFAMQAGERRLAEVVGVGGFGQTRVLRQGLRRGAGPNDPSAPPLSREPERFPGNHRPAQAGVPVTPSVSRPTRGRLLSRVSPTVRSFCLRVSGAVAPSAPNRSPGPVSPGGRVAGQSEPARRNATPSRLPRTVRGRMAESISRWAHSWEQAWRPSRRRSRHR